MNTIDSGDLLQKMQQMVEAAKTGSTGNNNTENNTEFSSIISGLINTVNSAQSDAASLKTGYESGDQNINLTQVMIASQKSEISFQALLQVRNKLLSAYQEVMRMQI